MVLAAVPKDGKRRAENHAPLCHVWGRRARGKCLYTARMTRSEYISFEASGDYLTRLATVAPCRSLLGARLRQGG